MDNLTTQEPSNIVALNESSAHHLEILKKSQKEKHACIGMHKKIVVDSITRTVECAACGRAVDPFDYLEQWATEGDRRMLELKAIEIQRRVYLAECSELERKINQLRAQLKRRGQPQSHEERAAFRSARWNPDSAETEVLLAKYSLTTVPPAPTPVSPCP